jgi:hypothetical protein
MAEGEGVITMTTASTGAGVVTVAYSYAGETYPRKLSRAAKRLFKPSRREKAERRRSPTSSR